MWWLFPWRHQAITGTNADLPSQMLCDIRLRAIAEDVLTTLIHNVCYIAQETMI